MFEQEWARCEGWLAKAHGLCPQGYSLDDIRDGAARGEHIFFWPGKRAAIVGEVIVMPQAKWFRFWLVAGDLREIDQMRPMIEGFAKRMGCTRSIGGGRKGWERHLAPHGYRPLGALYDKELT